MCGRTAAGAALFLRRLRWHQSWRLDLRSNDRGRLGPAGASVTHLATLSGGDECRRRAPLDAPVQVSGGAFELAIGKELTQSMAWKGPHSVLSTIVRLRSHARVQAQEQIERSGRRFRGLGKRERRSEAGRREEVMQTRPHGPPRLRPFPDADASVS